MHTDGSTTRAHGAGDPRLLYARPGIVVTGERFTVGGTSWRIAELTQLRTARGPHDRLAVRAMAVTGALVAAVGLLLGFTGGLQRLTAEAYLALGAVGLLPLLLVLAGDRWHPPAYELWGRHRGVEVLLFASDDERQFGQVTRALRRARDTLRDTAGEDWSGAYRPWRPAR